MTKALASGTNSCTGAVISKGSFTFDTSTEHGKLNLSAALMAFASGKTFMRQHIQVAPVTLLVLLYFIL